MVNLPATSPTNCRPRCTKHQVCILQSWCWSTSFYCWPDCAQRSLIPSCIFAIFRGVMAKSCIIAIFLRFWPVWPYIRDRRTNRAASRKFQTLFENGSALPPVFLLLVKGWFGRCENHRPFTIKVHRHIKPAFGCKWHYAAGGWLSVCLDMSTNIILRVASYRKKGRPILLQFNQQRQKPPPFTAGSVLPPTSSEYISAIPPKKPWTTKFCI